MSKKLLLILPRNKRGFWGKVHSGKAGLVRLSLSTIAALTPPDWQVEIIDSRVQDIDYHAHADLVGITAFTGEVPYAYQVADQFRQRKVKVVFGGVHASALPDEVLMHADSVVVGEAEYVWGKLLDDFVNGQLKSRYQAQELCSMEKMAAPRMDLLKPEMYYHFNTLQATRGCPFDCDYCAVTGVFGRKFRVRPVAEVIEQIKAFKGREFIFLDDNICGNKAYAKELFKALIPLKKVWASQVSLNFANDDELLTLYGKSGGYCAYIGFETISQDSLTQINKRWNQFNSYASNIRKIHQAGINIIGSFIFGLDQDTLAVFEQTLDFIDQENIDAAQFHILTPFPGTRLFNEMEKAGRILDRDWSKYTTCEVVYQPKNFTRDQLQKEYYKAYRKAYSLRRILKRVFRDWRGIDYRLAMNFSYRNKALRMERALPINY